MNFKNKRLLTLVSIGFVLGITLLWALGSALPGMAYARAEASSTLGVDTTADDNTPAFQACTSAANDCSLRGAISKANSDTANAYSIYLPAGTYTLALSGAKEDGNATGDLDINCSLAIVGAGADLTTIDGNQLDRVINISGVGNVEISPECEIDSRQRAAGFVYACSCMAKSDLEVEA